MLKYRALLVDRMQDGEKPVQAFFNDVSQIQDWAKKHLQRANQHAYVVVYRVREIEVQTIQKGDYDQSPISGVQPSSGKTG